MKVLVNTIVLIVMVSCGSGGNSEVKNDEQREYEEALALAECPKEMDDDFGKAYSLLAEVEDIVENERADGAETVKSYLEVADYVESKYKKIAKCKDKVETRYHEGEWKEVVYYKDYRKEYDVIVKSANNIKLIVRSNTGEEW